MKGSAPVYDVDLYSDAAIRDPYPHYQALRELGPAVWLPHHNVWAISRYADVVDCLRNFKVFSSASGVSLNEEANRHSIGTTLSSDPPLHDKLRKLMAAPLQPAELSKMRARFQAEADALIDRLIMKRRFDVVADLAQHLPVTIVTQLVGLPIEGRDNMLAWAAAVFDAIGPANERGRRAVPALTDMREFSAKYVKHGLVAPGSWTERLLNLVDANEIELQQVPILMRDYLGPSLDTTILATASLIWLFCQHPDQWALLRQKPNLARNAVNEAVRLESPIRAFSRKLLSDYKLGDTMLKKGSRALILYGSANRDERKWDNATRFDITRKVVDHAGFGFGIHSCAGMNLARLEMDCLLRAMIPKIGGFSDYIPILLVNNSLRGLDRLEVTVTPA